MLSATIHTAALAHAAHVLPAGATESTIAAVVDTYETAYGRGFRERPVTARFPLAGDAAFKRLLGAYLAENITVYHPATGRYGLLKGLPYCAEGDGEPYADVEFYADAEAREEGGGDLVEPYGKLLPVLYAPEDLATELVLADGLPIVPVKEVANLWGLHGKVDTQKVLQILNGEQIGRFAMSVEVTLDDVLIAAELLRHWGFAVGLQPHQYHRRVAGFDYASGGRPEKCAGCERKEVCRG